ncbi:hypothetical protein [Paraburkholderia hospita]|uniref:hypothetical protein n=1 Tax=Paraburkholderia hospita TaxID=169430 RepID=UPI000B349017|nr:hypothetical protein [Paraburkholderia hospita]OUL79906.1 hypothetical protein CA603_33040 [Paraburkholderia hospita]
MTNYPMIDDKLATLRHAIEGGVKADTMQALKLMELVDEVGDLFKREIADASSPAVDAGAIPAAWRYLTPTGWHATTDSAKASAVSAHHDVEPLYTRAPSNRLQNLTDEQMLDAIKAVCGFDSEGVERWRTEALIIARAIEAVVLRASDSATASDKEGA